MIIQSLSVSVPLAQGWLFVDDPIGSRLLFVDDTIGSRLSNGMIRPPAKLEGCHKMCFNLPLGYF